MWIKGLAGLFVLKLLAIDPSKESATCSRMPETMMSGAILMHSAELAAGDNASEVCLAKDSAI